MTSMTTVGMVTNMTTVQMGQAAEHQGQTIQYCMSHPRHIMQALEVPAVTNARASGDYHPVSGNDSLG